MRFGIALLLTFFIGRPAFAWSEGGHHLISAMAYELLNAEERAGLQTILKAHPRFAEDFQPPKKVVGPEQIELWMIGRAGYWPDVAGSKPRYNRLEWHYQKTFNSRSVAGQPWIGTVKNLKAIIRPFRSLNLLPDSHKFSPRPLGRGLGTDGQLKPTLRATSPATPSATAPAQAGYRHAFSGPPLPAALTWLPRSPPPAADRTD